MLHSLWVARGRGETLAASAAAAAVVWSFVARVRVQVHADWRRCQTDVRLSSGVPPSWLVGRRPELSLAEFRARWCAGGVVARVAHVGEGWELILGV